jgi:hypothetical protein
MSTVPLESRGPTASDKDAIWELIRNLVLGEANPEYILELYYWSQDPEVLALLRAFVELPEDCRHSMTAFVTENDPKRIGCEQQSAEKRLILTA